MNIFRSPEEFHRWNISHNQGERHHAVATVGNFDGVHKGHAALITEVVTRARAEKRQSIVITFNPHTRSIITPGTVQPVLSTLDEKTRLIADFDVDHLVCVEFNEKFRALSPEEFLKTVLISQLSVKEWVVGKSHTFGADRAGNRNSLQKIASRYNINVFTLDLVAASDTPISSTEIRGLISRGELSAASGWLGHPYLIAPKRVAGQQIGRKLGYPTLNFCLPDPGKVLPPAGVYAARLESEGRLWSGAFYYGNCPTFENRDIRFEMHLTEYSGDEGLPQIGETGYIWLRSFVRNDRAFETEAALVEQIKTDINTINRFFIEEQ